MHHGHATIASCTGSAHVGHASPYRGKARRSSRIGMLRSHAMQHLHDIARVRVFARNRVCAGRVHHPNRSFSMARWTHIISAVTTSKHGTDSRGNFVIEYGGPRRIQWHRGPAADAVADQLRPAPTTSVASSGTREVTAKDVLDSTAGAASAIASIASAFGSAAGGVGAVIQATAFAAQAWEQRQARLAIEHAANVNARLDLTYRMLDRWHSAHADGGCLDIDLSKYLNRVA